LQLDELYEFLDANNTEDPDHVFREHYSKDFLKWTLVGSDDAKDMFEGFEPVYVAVEVEATHKLVAFIAAVPMVLRVFNKYAMCGHITFISIINFLIPLELCRSIMSSC